MYGEVGVRGSFEPPSENPSCGAQVESSPKRNELKKKPARKGNATEQIKSLILVLRNRMDVDAVWKNPLARALAHT
jgi:hypothetical protein